MSHFRKVSCHDLNSGPTARLSADQSASDRLIIEVAEAIETALAAAHEIAAPGAVRVLHAIAELLRALPRAEPRS